MKANEAPEKIYLQEPTKVRTEGLYDNDVEYICTDAFIEKACQFIKENHHKYSSWNIEEYGLVFNTETFIEDFKNYIKENKSMKDKAMEE